MSIQAIVGINWGDEGKGRMVDLVASDFDYVVRYQGGNNAGHTVKNNRGKFILNLLPSGVFNDNTCNILGAGMVIDLEHLYNEVKDLKAKGIELDAKRLLISDRALICFPFHKAEDIAQEAWMGNKAFGSTKRGIGPAYGDKYRKRGIQMGELLGSKERLEERLKSIIEWKNLTLAKAYDAPEIKFDEVRDWLYRYAEVFTENITDTRLILEKAASNGKNILFEAQLGALRDIDYGIYPFTSSSTPLAAYAPLGSGAPSLKVDSVLGIIKAYSSCVGAGPFTCELFGKEAEDLRAAGGEYGAATGRPRRVGPFDVVASRYGCAVQGADTLALTKLDVLSYLPRIPVCVAYKINGKTVHDFPHPALLDEAEPVIEYWPGWESDIADIKNFEDLPAECQAYINGLEGLLGAKFKYISVGPEREAYILRT